MTDDVGAMHTHRARQSSATMEAAMNPKSYESLASQHIDTMRREAAGGHVLARAGVVPAGHVPFLRRWIDRLESVGHRTPVDVTGPGRDLGTARRPELGQDVLNVTARRLGRDAK